MDSSIFFEGDEFYDLYHEKKNLRNQGKYSSFDPNKHEKLLRYIGIIEDNIYWSYRFQFLEILETLVRESLNGDPINKLITKFIHLRGDALNATNDWCENFKRNGIIMLNRESYDFTDIIQEIFFMLESYDDLVDIPDPDSPSSPSKKAVLLEIEKYYFPRIRQYCEGS